MTDHPRLLEALRLVESGRFDPSATEDTLTPEHGEGMIWAFFCAGFLGLTEISGGTTVLTEAGKRRLEEAKE